jgi:hypothetical protein
MMSIRMNEMELHTDIDMRHIVQSVEFNDVVSESRFLESANFRSLLCVDLLLLVSACP